MKTAVTVLQEMMVKMGVTPEYECIAQSGPQHQAMFDYRCKVCGLVATASARSKKEAKQEVARVMLQQLSTRGHAVPPPFGVLQPDRAHAAYGDAGGGAGGGVTDIRSYVALLRELCEEYRLAGVEYELVGDTGPAHCRHFTVRARIGHHERIATSTTKKTARQLAAEQLYTYLRENLARVTKDFNEEDALLRAHERAMERYMDTCEELPRKPDLGQRIADYHLGLTARLDAESRASALKTLDESSGEDFEADLERVCGGLRVGVQWAELERESGGVVHVVQVCGAEPDLAFPAPSRHLAARLALLHVRDALTHAHPASTTI